MKQQVCLKCGNKKTGILRRIVNGREILENIDLKYYDKKDGELKEVVCLICTAKENAEKKKAEAISILATALKNLTKWKQYGNIIMCVLLEKYLSLIRDQAEKLLKDGFSGEINITLDCNQGGIRNGKINIKKSLTIDKK